MSVAQSKQNNDQLHIIKHRKKQSTNNYEQFMNDQRIRMSKNEELGRYVNHDRTRSAQLLVKGPPENNYSYEHKRGSSIHINNQHYQNNSNYHSKQTVSSFNKHLMEGFASVSQQQLNANIPYVSDKEQHSYLKAINSLQKQNTDHTNFISEYYQNRNAADNANNHQPNLQIKSNQNQLAMKHGSMLPRIQSNYSEERQPSDDQHQKYITNGLQQYSNTNSQVVGVDGRRSTSKASVYHTYLNHHPNYQYNQATQDDARQHANVKQPSPQIIRKNDPIFNSPNNAVLNKVSDPQALGPNNASNKIYQTYERQQSWKNEENKREGGESLQPSIRKSQRKTPQLNAAHSDSVPRGCFESLLFLAQVSKQEQVSIRIPDTIISGGHYETKLLLNKVQSIDGIQQQKGPLLNLNGQAPLTSNLKSDPLSSLKLPHKDIEQTLCSWLQLNIEKSKQGSFVPICMKKFKPQKLTPVTTQMDFFVAAGLSSFNTGLKETKGTFLGGDVFMMQRYVPSRDEYPQIYRTMWRKNKGYKVYQFTSIYPYNGQLKQDQNMQPMTQDSQQQSSSGDHLQDQPDNSRQASPQMNQQRVLEDLKLLTFDDLSKQYEKVVKLGSQRIQILQQITEGGGIQAPSNSKEVHIDLTSLKTQQHIIMQQEIQSNFSVLHQFQLLDKERKTYKSMKIDPNKSEYQRLFKQIHQQTMELIKLINNHLLQSEGLQLQKITVDFIEDYQDQLVYFLQIESFIVETIIQQRPQNLDYSIQHRKAISNHILSENHQFKCNGDYCFISEQSYVPRHLAPIVAKIQKFDVPKVPKKTVVLERELIKDNYRAYKQSRNQFKTMVDQELLMRRSLDNNDQVDVCPSCFFIYNYLQDQYYDEGNGAEASSTEDSLRKNYHTIQHQHSNWHGHLPQIPQNMGVQHTHHPYRPDNQRFLTQKMHDIHQLHNMRQEEIKEDYVAENRESLDYDEEEGTAQVYEEGNDADADADADEDAQFDDRDDMDEQEENDDEEGQPLQNAPLQEQQRQEVAYVRQRSKFSIESGENSPSRFNIGVQELSPDTINNRDTNFKIPSEIYQTANKNTFISNFTNQSNLPRHLRNGSNASQLDQQLTQNLNSQKGLESDELYLRPYTVIDNNSFNSNQDTQMNLPSTNTESKYQHTEFNPPLKFNIKPKQNNKGAKQEPILRNQQTSTFGEGSRASQRSNAQQQQKSQKSLKLQTFNVVQIIDKIRRKNSKTSQQSFEDLTSPQKVNPLVNCETVKNLGNPNPIPESFQNSIKNSSQNSKQFKPTATPPLYPHSQSSSHKNSPRELTQQKSISSVKEKKNLSNGSISGSIKQARQYLKNKETGCQVGDSLTSIKKPPKSSIGIGIQSSFIKGVDQSIQKSRTSQDQQMDQLSHNYQFSDDILRVLTQQTNEAGIQLATKPYNQVPRNSDINKRHLTQDLKLPTIKSPTPDLLTGQTENNDSILQVPPVKILDQILLNNSGRSNKSTSKVKTSSMRLRSHSLRDQQVYQALQDTDLMDRLQGNISNTGVNLAAQIEEPEILSKKSKQNSVNKSSIKHATHEDQQSMISQKRSDTTRNNVINTTYTLPNEDMKIELVQEEDHEEGELEQTVQKQIVIDHDPDEVQSLDYQVMEPKSPPKLTLGISQYLYKTPSRMNVSDSTKKVDSFFGGNENGDEEYMMDYIISNEEDASSIMMSNPQLRNIVTKRTNGLGGLILNSVSKQSLYKNNNTLPIIQSNRNSSHEVLSRSENKGIDAGGGTGDGGSRALAEDVNRLGVHVDKSQ